MLLHMQTRLTRSTRQDGAALLILLVIVIIATTGVLLNSLNRASVLQRSQMLLQHVAELLVDMSVRKEYLHDV